MLALIDFVEKSAAGKQAMFVDQQPARIARAFFTPV